MNEFQKRRAAVAKSLFAIGESALARDFASANEAYSFEQLEHTMRERLKSNVNARWAKVVANAIVEAQCLPHLLAQPQA